MAESAPALDEALRRVHDRIAEACRRASRRTSEVTLIAVSKTVSAARVEQARIAGQTVFGENRVQEALAKIDALPPGLDWHLIGTLQRNKARHVAGRFRLIHVVDGERLSDELDRRCRAAGVVQPVLIQVNSGAEATKHGVAPQGAAPLAAHVAGCAGLELRGLMTIPPPAERPEDNRRWFAGLRELRDRLDAELSLSLPELSMGMTDDFEVAVEEGATLVRVGRAIFGERAQP